MKIKLHLGVHPLLRKILDSRMSQHQILQKKIKRKNKMDRSKNKSKMVKLMNKVKLNLLRIVLKMLLIMVRKMLLMLLRTK